MEMNSKPTLLDVAKLAGVSTATVSRCLNKPENVVKATRDKVEAAIEALGYTPNFGGRLLASNRSSIIGAIIPTMENSIFARGIQAFQEELRKSGVTLLISSSGYDPQREFEQVRTLVSQGVEGILLIGVARPEKTYDFLHRRNIPYVITWNYRQNNEHLYAGFDNFAAMHEMTTAVINRGHERIGLITGPSEYNDRIEDRIAGAKSALEDSGLNNLSLGNASNNHSTICAGDAFEKLISDADQLTAVLCGNDVLAVGAILRARKLGIRIPDDVSITGFDDIDLAEVIAPPLTTVHVPHRRMGEAAAQILLELRSGIKNQKSIKIETHVVLRGSLADCTEH
jgi:LacI family transcriptional regulator